MVYFVIIVVVVSVIVFALEYFISGEKPKSYETRWEHPTSRSMRIKDEQDKVDKRNLHKRSSDK